MHISCGWYIPALFGAFWGSANVDLSSTGVPRHAHAEEAQVSTPGLLHREWVRFAPSRFHRTCPHIGAHSRTLGCTARHARTRASCRSVWFLPVHRARHLLGVSCARLRPHSRTTSPLAAPNREKNSKILVSAFARLSARAQTRAIVTAPAQRPSWTASSRACSRGSRA